jgi:hypothetical protein
MNDRSAKPEPRKTYKPVSGYGKVVFCNECGSEDTPKTVTPGSFLIEVVLWFFFIVPGLIYSLWRGNARYKCCRQCGSRSVIPPGTPAALARKRELGVSNDA